jgi:hypothetical protein
MWPGRRKNNEVKEGREEERNISGQNALRVLGGRKVMGKPIYSSDLIFVVDDHLYVYIVSYIVYLTLA